MVLSLLAVPDSTSWAQGETPPLAQVEDKTTETSETTGVDSPPAPTPVTTPEAVHQAAPTAQTEASASPLLEATEQQTTPTELNLGQTSSQDSFAATQPSRLGKAAWISVATTLALATSSGVLSMAAKSREDDIANLIAFRDAQGQALAFDSTTQKRYQDLVDEGDKLSTWSTITLAAAGVTAATAVTLFVLDKRKSTERKQAILVPQLASGHIGLSTVWGF